MSGARTYAPTGSARLRLITSVHRQLPDSQGRVSESPDRQDAHVQFLADQAKVAGNRERAEGPKSRVERLCLSGSGVDLVLRAAKLDSHVPATPAIQPRGDMLAALGRPLGATAMPEGPYVRRGPLQKYTGARQAGAAHPMPGSWQVEAFDPSEEDRLTSIELRPAKQPFHGAVTVWVATAVAAMGILAGFWVLSLCG